MQEDSKLIHRIKESNISTNFEKTDELLSIISDNQLLSQIKTVVEEYIPTINQFQIDVNREKDILEDSHYKRQLYVNIEMVRMDFSEVPCIDRFLTVSGHVIAKRDQILLKQLQDSDIYKEVYRVLNILDQYRLDLAIKPNYSNSLHRLLNTLLFTVFVFYGCLFSICLTPLRLFHPILRKLNVPTHYLPIDVLQIYLCKSMTFWGGWDVYYEGLDNVNPKHQSYVSLYSHQSSIDPFALCCSPVRFKLIGKTSLFFIPIIGWLAFLFGHININRKNLEKAKKSLQKAVFELKQSQRSVLIAPEGTRSQTGRMSDFKKGPFHTALQANFPISPMVIIGASEVWHAKQWGAVPGRIIVRILPPISIEKEDTHITLMRRTRRAMLTAYAEPFKGGVIVNNTWIEVLAFPISVFACHFIKNLIFG